MDRPRRGRFSTGPGLAADLRRRRAIDALLDAMGDRDQRTRDHSHSVLDIVERVSRDLTLTETARGQLRDAALLHDVGKVALPRDLLSKDGELEDSERELIETHPSVGASILVGIGLADVAHLVRHCHERWDGTGYPDRLRGHEIPLASRVIFVCDAYDAMVSDRPYRRGMQRGEALDELSRHAGSQFDPAVVEAALDALAGPRQGASS